MTVTIIGRSLPPEHPFNQADARTAALAKEIAIQHGHADPAEIIICNIEDGKYICHVPVWQFYIALATLEIGWQDFQAANSAELAP